MANVILKPDSLEALGAKLVIEGNVGYIEMLDGTRFKAGTVVSTDPLVIETKLDLDDWEGYPHDFPYKSLEDKSRDK